MGAVCKECRHCTEGSFKRCMHPSAGKIDRVGGLHYPYLSGPFPEDEIKKTTDKCDAQGWFEPKATRKPWWVFF